MAVVAPNAEGNGGFLTVELTGVAGTTGGAIAAVANPEGVTCQILRSFFDVITPSTGVAAISVGVAADATTSSTDMVNALTVNGVTALTVYAGSMGGDATKDSLVAAPAPWTSDKYVTVTGSATTAGFTGRLFIEYIRIAA